MMGFWRDERTGTEWSWDDIAIEVDVSENPVVAELLDHTGAVIRQWRERPPVGFR